MEAGKKAAGEVLALQKRVLAVLNEARYDVICLKILDISVGGCFHIECSYGARIYPRGTPLCSVSHHYVYLGCI